MEIQKIFSDQYDEERYYSVLMNEEELRFFTSNLPAVVPQNLPAVVQQNLPAGAATAPSSSKQELAKKSQNFISRHWNKLGTKGKIGVGATVAAGVGYGAYKLATRNKKKDQ